MENSGVKKEIIQAAQKSALFKGMDAGEAAALLEVLSPAVQSFEKGGVIVLEGDKPASLGLIIKGEASALKVNAAGDTLTAARLTEGGVFGDMLAAGEHTKSPVTVIAQTACTAAFIKYSALFDAQKSSEENGRKSSDKDEIGLRFMLLKNMMQNMAHKYFLQEQRVSVLAEKNLTHRVKRYLRYEAHLQGAKTVRVPPRAELAALLACDRAALCRVLSQLQKSGEIAVNRREIELI